MKLCLVQHSAADSHQFGVMVPLQRLQGGDRARGELGAASQAPKNGVFQYRRQPLTHARESRHLHVLPDFERGPQLTFGIKPIVPVLDEEAPSYLLEGYDAA